MTTATPRGCREFHIPMAICFVRRSWTGGWRHILLSIRGGEIHHLHESDDWWVSACLPWSLRLKISTILQRREQNLVIDFSLQSHFTLKKDLWITRECINIRIGPQRSHYRHLQKNSIKICVRLHTDSNLPGNHIIKPDFVSTLWGIVTFQTSERSNKSQFWQGAVNTWLNELSFKDSNITKMW